MSQPSLPFAAILLAASLLGGCGQKGPLYLPQEAAVPAPVQAQSPAAASLPVTSAESPAQQLEQESEQQQEKTKTRRDNDSETAAEQLEPVVEK
ncbi:LPS translocon maturation chaperone LptM [Microbulbifer aestuariivivens]|uniref:LPS translocon maturation chaperone LptM n=1 Tax=Microbulbifer aestuariivivens TaxID=1908308 RepID=UPI0031ED6DE9